MTSFIAGFALFSTLFSLSLSDFSPVVYLRSLFTTNSLPVHTRSTKSYTIALVGDSMTEVLGTADPLHQALKYYYPDREFGILNFGIGSTSILSVPDRLTQESRRGSETLPPILSTKPDIILLESFGNNPLSQYPLSQGLKRQTEVLDQIVKIIKEDNPQTVLIFVATISPSREKYAAGEVNLPPKQREKWADERIAYIKNHINYAKFHNIPVINIYEKSLDGRGDGSLEYLSSSNYIHPSAAGVQLISQQIADFIFVQNIIPQ